MSRFSLTSLAAGCLIVACVITVAAQPPEGKGLPGNRKGQSGGKEKFGPPRFELGRLVPRPIREELRLTEDQISKLEALEKEVKDRLMKILTEDQKKRLTEMEQRRPGNKGGPPQTKDSPPPPNQDDHVAGIQWFGTLKRGLQEAQRTGRPILFLAAAPHCGGIPGIW